jgi:hypothetical protein
MAIQHFSPEQWPATRIVARLPGSLPLGGVVQDTPVYAFDSPLALLRLQTAPGLQPRRHDIALANQLAFMIHGVITDDEADKLIAVGEKLGFLDEAPGIYTPPGMRMNQSVHWVADPTFMDPLFDRIRHFLPPQIDGARLHLGFSQRINMYRYKRGDVFHRHTDGDWPAYTLSPDRRQMIELTALRSRLTMLLYLNDARSGLQGGATRLFSRTGGNIDVEPRKGSALFFRHGTGQHSVAHEGCPVSSARPKYVARINVIYNAQTT